MDLDKARKAHDDWKVKLRLAMIRHEQLDAATIAKDNACELGKWLQADGVKHAAAPEYRECKAKHAAFHVEAGKVAKMINDGKHTEAEAALGSGSAFSKASFEAIGAIGKLQKHVA